MTLFTLEGTPRASRISNIEFLLPATCSRWRRSSIWVMPGVLKRDQLTRQIINARGQLVKVPVMLLPGTNSSIRTSAGMELQILLPVINVPFRVIYAINPNRLDRSFVGPTTGSPFGIHEKFSEFKFTVGRTF